LHSPEGFYSISGGTYFIARVFKQAAETVSFIGIVIDDQDSASSLLNLNPWIEDARYLPNCRPILHPAHKAFAPYRIAGWLSRSVSREARY
jgi:hypothetical protein